MTNLSNTIVQPHKEVESLIRALYDLHVGFDVVRTRVLSPAGLPTTVSKADTLKGAVEAAQKMNTTDSVRVVSFLYNAVIDVVKYSNKFCRSLVLEGDEPERIIQKAKAELAAGNDFKASFPCFPKGEVNPQGRHLVAKVEESGEKVFIFLGKQRTVSERINIPNSAIVADSLAAGTRLVKVSAEALVPYNVLDVLVIDKSSKICEVRLSNCVDGGKRKRALWMKEAVSHVLNMGGISRRVASVNLFSKIRPLYKSFEKRWV